MQHGSLATKARRTPGLPLLYLHGNAVNLERASEESKRAAGVVAHERLVPLHETARLPALLEQEGLTPEDPEDTPLHRKKKLKGPNPLSVLKRKRGGGGGGGSGASVTLRQERRKWRRVRRLREPPPRGGLEDAMLRELGLEAAWGDRGRAYRRKSLAELRGEVRVES